MVKPIIGNWIGVEEKKKPSEYSIVTVTNDFQIYRKAWWNGNNWDSGKRVPFEIKYWSK